MEAKALMPTRKELEAAGREELVAAIVAAGGFSAVAQQVRNWATVRARRVTLRARWVTLRARWVTLRARWVTLRARWVTL
jgi:hypothetical protein